MEVKSLFKKNLSLPPKKTDNINQNDSQDKNTAQGEIAFRIGYETPKIENQQSEKKIVFQRSKLSPSNIDKTAIKIGFEKLNDLSALLNPVKDQTLQRNLSIATIKSMRKDLKNENWIQKIKRGSNAGMVSEQKTGTGILKDTSFNTLQPNFSKLTLLNQQQQQTLSGKIEHQASQLRPIKEKNLFEQTQPFDSFLPAIQQVRKQLAPRSVFSGKSIDEIYTKNSNDMLRLIDEQKNIKSENNQLKAINEKLVDRMELLNNIIEKEAAAGTYYYNCPPKADNSLVQNTIAKKADNEGQKVKKMYEDMIEQQRKQFESQIKILKQSTADEIEQLTQMFSKTSKELVDLTLAHRVLTEKMNSYVQKSEVFIKDQTQKLTEKTNEVIRLKDEFSIFDKRLNDKKNEADNLKKQLKQLNEEHSELKKVSTRQSAVIKDYEERYKGIDITKLHEEIELYKTQLVASQTSEKIILNQLYKIRDQMFQIAQEYERKKQLEFEKYLQKPKTYTGPALDYTDKEKAKFLRMKEVRMGKVIEWKGEQDIEMLSGMFMDFLTTPTYQSYLKHEQDPTPVQNIKAQVQNKLSATIEKNDENDDDELDQKKGK